MGHGCCMCSRFAFFRPLFPFLLCFSQYLTLEPVVLLPAIAAFDKQGCDHVSTHPSTSPHWAIWWVITDCGHCWCNSYGLDCNMDNRWEESPQQTCATKKRTPPHSLPPSPTKTVIYGETGVCSMFGCARANLTMSIG